MRKVTQYLSDEAVLDITFAGPPHSDMLQPFNLVVGPEHPLAESIDSHECLIAVIDFILAYLKVLYVIEGSLRHLKARLQVVRRRANKELSLLHPESATSFGCHLIARSELTLGIGA